MDVFCCDGAGVLSLYNLVSLSGFIRFHLYEHNYHQLSTIIIIL